jgi:hypothetical protein
MADQQALHTFAQWVADCSGNEKQEGQTFVQKLLFAWGCGSWPTTSRGCWRLEALLCQA